MRFTFALLFLLLFFSQNTFSQDYSKMSANEKAKVIIYGDLYPYSLLLESGTDTLQMYHLGRDLTLFFEEGVLKKSLSYEDTTIFYYERDKIIKRYEGRRYGAYVYFPRYRNDTLKGIADLIVKYDGRNYSSGQYYYREDMCLTNNRSDILCFFYSGDTIFAIEDIWVFSEDKITCEKRILNEFAEIENLKKTYYIKDEYLHILIENYHTKDTKSSAGFELQYDFIMEEKHEIKFKIIKSPKDKPRKSWEGY